MLLVARVQTMTFFEANKKGRMSFEFKSEPTYVGRTQLYYSNTPLYSSPYKFCTSHADCAKGTVDAKRCFSVDTNLDCMPGDTCICTDAVLERPALKRPA